MKENFIKVCCDAPGCGWEKDEHVDQIKQWHNADCPACGHSPVLSDEDIALIAEMVSLRDAGLMAIGAEAQLGKPALVVTFDTAGLRKATNAR